MTRQNSKHDAILSRYTDLSWSTERTRFEPAVDAVRKFLALANITGEIASDGWVHCQSPRDYLRQATQHDQEYGSKLSPVDIIHALITPVTEVDYIVGVQIAICDDVNTNLKNHPNVALAEFMDAAWGFAVFDQRGYIVDRPSHIVPPDLGAQSVVWHCEDGPVLAWPDGYEEYAIQGHWVDETVVMYPTTQNIADIVGDQNLERRRIRIERYGWPKFLRDAGATVIDKQVNDLDGGTYEVLLSAESMTESRIFAVTCPTGRLYCLEVPIETGTCQEARQYLNTGVPEDSLSMGRT